VPKFPPFFFFDVRVFARVLSLGPGLVPPEAMQGQSPPRFPAMSSICDRRVWRIFKRYRIFFFMVATCRLLPYLLGRIRALFMYWFEDLNLGGLAPPFPFFFTKSPPFFFRFFYAPSFSSEGSPPLFGSPRIGGLLSSHGPFFREFSRPRSPVLCKSKQQRLPLSNSQKTCIKVNVHTALKKKKVFFYLV